MQRTLPALLVLAAVLPALGTAAAAAPSAPPACTTSNSTIDTPTYSGPWPDNWEISVTACAQRIGPRVRHYAIVTWDVASTIGMSTFNPSTGLQIDGHRPGRAPARTQWLDLYKPLNTGKDGHRASKVFDVRGTAAAQTSVALYLDWRNDGKDAVRYAFRASPAV